MTRMTRRRTTIEEGLQGAEGRGREGAGGGAGVGWGE